MAKRLVVNSESDIAAKIESNQLVAWIDGIDVENLQIIGTEKVAA